MDLDVRELQLTAARAFAAYFLMLLVVRALGKRTIGNFAAFDLIVALMLGEVVDEIIFADVTFFEGTAAIVVIAGAQAGNSWLTWWGHGLDRLLEGTPTAIIRDGVLVASGMRKERMNAKDVIAHLRSQGFHDLREVKLALVEDDGTVSVIRRAWAEPVKKADVDRAAALHKQQDTNGQAEPVGRDRTDAPEWLQ